MKVLSPKRWWFQNLSAALAVLMAFLPLAPRVAEAAPKAEADRFKALNLDARAQLQATDFERWKKQEAGRVAVDRMVALDRMRKYTGAAAQEEKAAKAKKVALEIQRARPTALAERALARGKVLGLSPAQKQVELAKVDPPLAARLKTRKPPAVDPEKKLKLAPERMSPVTLPRPMAPRKSEHGALTPAMKSFYASVSGEGAEVLRSDGTTASVEETLAALSIPPLAQRHAALTSDLGMLMAPLSALPPPTADDLLETPETRRSPELLALAQQLGSRPLDLYNFVHTQVVPQLYYGSKKGAAQTLAELQGNDFDQSALLIALLRAAGHPARYEYGTVELSAAQAISLTGAKDLASAALMLSRTGPAALSPDGKSIQAERAWVRAYVPYELDRGSGPGAQKQWVRLDPGLKETKDLAKVSLKGLAAFDKVAFLAQPTTKTPLDVLEAQLLAVAKSKNLCNSLDDALSQLTVTQKPFALLPAEHPARVLTSLLVFARPPALYRHQVEVTLDGVTTPLELAELEGRALSLTYPGTTPQDAAAIAGAGGIAQVNPQFVSVRPTLQLDGVTKATFADVNPGTAQNLSMRLTVPGGSAVVGVHLLVAGTPYAVLVEGGTPSAAQLQARMLAATGTTGAVQWLARAQGAVAWYAHHTERTATRLYGLQGHGTIKDAFVAVAGKQLRVQRFLGLPVALAEGSYVLDVSRDSASPIPRDGDDSLQAGLVGWGGWQGSTLEGRAWEAVLGGPGMSSVKALQVATAQSVPVYVLTPSNQSNRANLSGYSADTLADIDNALAAHWTATVPQHPVSLGRFQNVEGYVLENPVNGEGAFRLGSSLNGGEGDDRPSGGPPECPTCGGPNQPTGSTVNLASGAWRYDETDLVLPAVGLPIVFSRVYSSRAVDLTALGYGWMHSYGVFLRAEAAGGFTYVSDDWREVTFAKVGSSYVTEPGWFLTLTDVAGGGHSMRSKDGLVWEFDASGALTRISEPSGNATTLVYAAGQLTQVKDSSGAVALTLSYTGSKLTSVLDRAGRLVRFGYTNDDLTAATDVLGHTEAYSYDENGNRASLTEGSTTFGYFYDSENRLKRADAFGGSLFFEYDAAGRRVSLSRPNGIRTAYTYDEANQILSLVHAKGPSVVLGFSYGYDAHGMRTSKTRETGYRETYGYDSADRLTRVDYGTAKRVEYGLDLRGNRVLEDTTTSPSTGLVRNTGVFNSFNQLTSSGGPGTGFPSTTNAWDLNGNLLTETKTPSGLPPEVTTYGWDKDDRLRTVTPPTGFATNYFYSATGLRTQRVDATGTTRYLLDGANVLEELDSANATTLKYFNNPQQIDDVLAYQRSSQTEFPLTDALGSVYAANDSSGSVVHRYDFDVYGKRTDLGGSAQVADLGFTGRRHDLNGLIQNGRRERSPLLGSWMSADPIGMGDGVNRYLYAHAEPVRHRDPNGTRVVTNDPDIRNALNSHIGMTYIGVMLLNALANAAITFILVSAALPDGYVGYTGAMNQEATAPWERAIGCGMNPQIFLRIDKAQATSYRFASTTQPPDELTVHAVVFHELIHAMRIAYSVGASMFFVGFKPPAVDASRYSQIGTTPLSLYRSLNHEDDEFLVRIGTRQYLTQHEEIFGE